MSSGGPWQDSNLWRSGFKFPVLMPSDERTAAHYLFAIFSLRLSSANLNIVLHDAQSAVGFLIALYRGCVFTFYITHIILHIILHIWHPR